MPGGNPQILVCTTAKPAERVKTVPITTRAGEKAKIVMRLGPEESGLAPLPDLRPGDELKVLVELAVTTDCKTREQGDCVKQPYAYSPRVRARLDLSENRTANRDRGQVIALAQETVNVSQDQHHYVFVLEAQKTIPKSWKARSKYWIVLTLDASYARAKPNQVVLVGANEKGGVRQDMARISIARLRPGDEAQPKAQIERALLTRELPLTKAKRVVLSLPVARLRTDEQLLVGSLLEAANRGLGYKARISARVVLADSASEIEPGREARKLDPLRGEIAEHNGTNCLAGASHKTRKVGVLRATKDTNRTHYVNLVCESADPVEGRTDGSLGLIRGSLAVTRFPAGWKG